MHTQFHWPRNDEWLHIYITISVGVCIYTWRGVCVRVYEQRVQTTFAIHARVLWNKRAFERIFILYIHINRLASAHTQCVKRCTFIIWRHLSANSPYICISICSHLVVIWIRVPSLWTHVDARWMCGFAIGFFLCSVCVLLLKRFVLLRVLNI